MVRVCTESNAHELVAGGRGRSSSGLHSCAVLFGHIAATSGWECDRPFASPVDPFCPAICWCHLLFLPCSPNGTIRNILNGTVFRWVADRTGHTAVAW